MTSILIGGGAFGKVYKEWFNGQWCAVKKVPDDPRNITEDLLRREENIYCTVNHPNVVKLVGRIYKEAGRWCFPMELIDGPDLKDVMFHPIQITLPIKSKIITGMCEGLLYLHNKGIAHRDLKPDNIKVENYTFRTVIIDLGLAKFQNDFYSGNNMGNLAYAAPEIIHQPYTKRNRKSDVWAMGKIIGELLVGYQIVHNNPAHYQVLLQEYPGYCEVVSEMIDGSPTPRATMDQVIDRIRRAEGQIGGSEPLVRVLRPLQSPLQPHHQPGPAGVQTMEPFRELHLELPPNFTLPNPLPPNHTITLNYITSTGGGLIQIKGEVQTKHGRIHHVWWMKSVPNALEMNSSPRFLK
ncbi:hypothetical protein NL108_013232 [Boleophthalmus pectinirostris]|uniref:receptor-interacting serine/threonine-protein kinase 1-like n=1 Tax=Boleophthalmus pectinirostris TaxID=150288 RepID=UPI0024326824|nr:receptor-interacting serine/threonine-protein kinase 1-like [Boleophthalmus pectinirostris]KAJ0066459.1 hypothetical protein NL108_013232 [Boleophthalmus pectinirostris]